MMLRATILVAALAIATGGYAQPAPPRPDAEAVAAEIRRLQKAATGDPGNAQLLARLSQAYAVANEPASALAVISGAVGLEPANPDFLLAQATLATWTGDYDLARESYRRLSTLDPLGSELLLNYARVSAWGGDTDRAVSEYRSYLKGRPDAADVWLELARTESWRGNYSAALSALETYANRFGPSEGHSRELASVMVSSGRPSRAEDLLTPLLAADPESYPLHLTRTIALARQQRAGEAFRSLETLRRMAPDSRDTRTAEQILRTELASSFDPRISMYSDSDSLEVRRFTPGVTLALKSGTRVSARYEQTRLQAAQGGGLDQLNGSTHAEVEQVTFGASQTLGPFSIAANVGYADAAGRDRASYSFSAHVRASDTLSFSAERMDGLVVISPRTVGLGLTHVAQRVQASWSPAPPYVVAMDVTHQYLSDGNERLELFVSPRRSFARTARFNLDLGVSAYLLETALDLDNGYYDPRRYEHYALTVSPYFKLHQNAGLALSLAGGPQRDSSNSAFQLGGTLAGDLTLGINAPWLLKVNASATSSQRLDSGAFSGFGGSVALVRRF